MGLVYNSLMRDRKAEWTALVKAPLAEQNLEPEDTLFASELERLAWLHAGMQNVDALRRDRMARGSASLPPFERHRVGEMVYLHGAAGSVDDPDILHAPQVAGDRP